ncbi:hypothetical protein CPT_Pollock3 [Escherichia phage Pollock]|uniref:Uncharacterized protein n=1 Tax=Escherichia phage Pollock TaxID=1540097 RepID=A0A0A0YRG4_9CAUD|nr:hypothetical protein ACQ44_gp03 [Escherichia phage Pollock]AIX12362.1 hypothetical protein CPT_Pollock3 [Escherichia phage Pollock]
MVTQITVAECVRLEWESHYYLPFIERYKLISLIKRILEN